MSENPIQSSNMDRLKDEIDRLETKAGEHQVSLAVLASELTALSRTVDKISRDQADQTKELKEIRAQLNTGRGLLVAIAFVLGSLATWIASKLFPV